MYDVLTKDTEQVKIENNDIFLDEISTANFLAFNGVIMEYLPLVVTPVVVRIILERPDGHTFTIYTARECLSPDQYSTEGRGGCYKPSPDHIILSLASMG